MGKAEEPLQKGSLDLDHQYSVLALPEKHVKLLFGPLLPVSFDTADIDNKQTLHLLQGDVGVYHQVVWRFCRELALVWRACWIKRCATADVISQVVLSYYLALGNLHLLAIPR